MEHVSGMRAAGSCKRGENIRCRWVDRKFIDNPNGLKGGPVSKTCREPDEDTHGDKGILVIGDQKVEQSRRTDVETTCCNGISENKRGERAAKHTQNKNTGLVRHRREGRTMGG